MIFLSAQPDESYFIWQLELQIFNLKNPDVASSNIHILIGYNPSLGPTSAFQGFIALNKDANFFLYPDNRNDREYVPSIRPHIIKQQTAILGTDNMSVH